jgi:hypothetical protein
MRYILLKIVIRTDLRRRKKVWLNYVYHREEDKLVFLEGQVLSFSVLFEGVEIKNLLLSSLDKLKCLSLTSLFSLA